MEPTNLQTEDINADSGGYSWMTDEERREINAEIDSLAGASRKAVSEEALNPPAKKSGGGFPLAVNIAVAAALACGVLILSAFHTKDEAAVRDSGAALGITERALIQEIRKESAAEVRAKEAEIDGILAKLSAVDAEYQRLQNALESGAPQDAEQNRRNLARLRTLQDEYQNTLSGLRGERALLLEGARSREAAARTRPEDAGETGGGPAPAREELRRLDGERRRLTAAEAQMEGLYEVIRDGISAGDFAGAETALQSAAALLDAPVFKTAPSGETTRKAHAAALASLETLLKQADAGAFLELRTQLAARDKTITEKDATITALQEANRTLSARVEELQRNIESIRQLIGQ
ncbi:MAG: Putative viral A-type inclusion protein [Treponematales bacterium]